MTAYLNRIYEWYWWRVLQRPLEWIEGTFGLEPQEGWYNFAWKAGFSLAILFVLMEIWLRIRQAVYQRNLRKSMRGHEVKGEPKEEDQPFTEELDAAQHPVKVITRLKKDKNYGRLGEIHAALNQPAEAAKWFLKARQTRRAAEELAKAGRTAKAAGLLWKCGDYGTSGRFYLAVGKPATAAKAFELADMPAEAARAHAEAGHMDKALDCFTAHFRQTPLDSTPDERMADLCYQLLADPAYAGRFEPARRKELLAVIGSQFLRAGRAALAAQALADAGEYNLAADIYARLGNRAMAQKCASLAVRGK